MLQKITFLGILVLLCACNKDNNASLDYANAKDFCPIKTGSFITYEVFDTLYNLGNIVVGSKYQLKIKVGEKVSDNTVLEKYKLERYKRPDYNAIWTLDSIWFETYTFQKEIVQYEANVPFVKLITPLKSSINWNGNKYNKLNSETYKTRNFDKNYFLTDTTFKNTVTIIQNDNFEDAIGYNYKFEVYAKNLGLIEKFSKTFRYSQTDTIVNKNEKVGMYRHMKYLTHGIE